MVSGNSFDKSLLPVSLAVVLVVLYRIVILVSPFASVTIEILIFASISLVSVFYIYELNFVTTSGSSRSVKID